MTDYFWSDDLIWCPSQCICNVTSVTGIKAVLYLRWRWDDPWTGSIYFGYHDGDGVSTTNPHTIGFEKWVVDGDRRDADIGFWEDSELDEAKAAIIEVWEREYCND